MNEGLFISYRRSDASGSTMRLVDHLRYNGFGGEGDMFLDIDQRIPPGSDFRVVINDTLAGCDLVIVVIGRHWLDASDEGQRRLDRPSDTHRLEVAAALNSAAWVIPVLVEGASHPSEEDLPDDLKELAYLQSWSLDERNYAADVETLAHEMLDARRQMEAERDRIPAEKTEGERAAAAARKGRMGVSRAYVFVSYAREDQKYVRRLVNHLNRLKIDTWTDDGIDHGTRWTAKIRDAIDDCAAFVVVMTPAAEESEWIDREIRRAQAKSKDIMPLLLKGTPLFVVGTNQYEDVSDGRMPASGFVKLLSHFTSTE